MLNSYNPHLFLLAGDVLLDTQVALSLSYRVFSQVCDPARQLGSVSLEDGDVGVDSHGDGAVVGVTAAVEAVPAPQPRLSLQLLLLLLLVDAEDGMLHVARLPVPRRS